MLDCYATPIRHTADKMTARLLCMPVKKRTLPDPNHPVIRGLVWIKENRKQPSGKKWSDRALSLAAKLNASHVGQILGGWQSPDIGRETALKLAGAADVDFDWFLRGVGKPGHFVSASPEATDEELRQAVEFIRWKKSQADDVPSSGGSHVRSKPPVRSTRKDVLPLLPEGGVKSARRR